MGNHHCEMTRSGKSQSSTDPNREPLPLDAEEANDIEQYQDVVLDFLQYFQDGESQEGTPELVTAWAQLYSHSPKLKRKRLYRRRHDTDGL